ncbi:MAG: signal peptide peptidase SppA, partial [Bacteroidetes bacterium]|nr:signal peptide peptidase SppA [Bacteroidota bacterium]
AAQLHLIDGVAYFDRFRKDVRKEVLGKSGGNGIVNPEHIHYWKTRWGRMPEVAVIGVYGTIVTGKSSPPSPFPIPFLGGDRLTGSESVIKQIEEAVADKNIKAIVLRVNSGGGSALASDEIYNAVREAMAKKPVVASFGNVAASGGYYVAVGAKKIFAEPATLTGSIGVLIAFPVLTDFIEKDLGGNVEQYKSRDASGVLNPFHKWDEKDMKYVDEFLNQTYTDFKEKVSEGRKLSMSRVDELAQGKVYTGDQAKNLGLIDEYGGLEKAIQYAANVAGISGGYRVKMFVVPGLGLGNLLRFGAELLDGYSD